MKKSTFKQSLFRCLLILTILFILFDDYIIDLIYYLLRINDNFVNNPFIPQYDYITQHIPFYEEFFRLMDSGNISYSWNLLMGTNFIGSKSFYMVGDVFAYIGYLLHCLYSYTPAIMFLLILCKIVVAYFLFNKFLGYHSNNIVVNSVLSVSYAFSGFVMVFVEQPMFLSFYAFFPLWLICVEQFINKDKTWRILLPISTAFIISTNPIMAFTGCFFLLIYWIVRFIQTSASLRLNCFFNASMQFLLFFLIGVGFSAPICIPFVKLMLNNPRVDSGSQLFSLKFKDVYSYIRGFYIPLMFNYEDVYYKGIYYVSQFAHYAGLISFIQMQCWFIQTYHINKKECISWLLTFVLLFGCLFIPQIWSLFTISQNLRWTFYFSVIMLVLSAKQFNQMDFKYRLSYEITYVINSIILVVLTYIYHIKFNAAHTQVMTQLVLAMIFIVMILGILIFKVNKNYLLILICAEIVVQSNFYIPFISVKSDVSNNILITEKNKYQTTYQALRQYDNTFYRVLLPDMDLNYGTYLGISTASAYDSTYEYGLNNFYKQQGILQSSGWHVDLFNAVNNGNQFALNSADVKYIITGKILENDNLLTEVNLNTPLYVYRVKGATGLASVIDNVTLNQSYIDPIFIDNCSVKFSLKNFNGNLIFKVPYDQNWNAFVNGIKHKVNSDKDGFISLDLNNANEVVFKFENQDFKIGCIVLLVSITLFGVVLFLYEKKV